MLAALRLLVKSDRFEAGLRQQLVAKGHSETNIDSVLEELKDKRFIDDSRVTGDAVSHKLREGKHGRIRIQAELEKLGADPAILEEWLNAAEETEFERAKGLAAQRIEKGDSPGKVARFLASRGFDEETVRSVLELLDPDWASDNSQ